MYTRGIRAHECAHKANTSSWPMYKKQKGSAQVTHAYILFKNYEKKIHERIRETSAHCISIHLNKSIKLAIRNI